MKPFYKYPGGKSKEIKNILPYLNKIKYERIVEPFAGGAALSFFLEKPSLVADINDNVSNIFNVVKDEKLFPLLIEKINSTNINEGDNKLHLEKLYYHYRDNEYGNNDPIIKSYRFLLLRQLGFSGMFRINHKTGKCNVPYGWYPEFKTRLNYDYHSLLQKWEIKNCSFQETFSKIKEGDFIFLDPPYFERNSKYGTGEDAGENEQLHIELFHCLTAINQPWLLIHSDCELYRNLYAEYFIQENNFTYSQNFKGRENKNAKVGHLYISNIELNNVLKF
jgi:DNA adenine methylase